MSQPAPKPSATPLRAQAPTEVFHTAAATPATPDALALHATAQLLKRTRHAEEKEQKEEQDTALLAQASTVEEVLLSQAAGGGAPAPEACPVAVAGVADPCGQAAAADAHPVGGALWALGLLPLLGAGGGGGGAKDPGPTDITVKPEPTPPGVVTDGTEISGSGNIRHPIDATGDNGKELADFDSNQANAVFRIVKVADAAGATVNGRAAQGDGDYDPTVYTGSDPATNPWFYLDKTTGILSLTAAGANAQCIGQSLTITVQAVANGRPSEQGQVTFTLTPPRAEEPHNHGVVDREMTKTVGSSFDVLKIDSEITQFHVFLSGNTLYIQTESKSPPSETTVSTVDLHLEGNALEYVSFNDLSYYGYSLGDKAAYTNYFKVATSLDENSMPVDSSLTGSGLMGSSCNDLLFNDGEFSIEKFFGGDGNDLIFVGPDDGSSEPGLSLFADGGAGNDLLVGSSGADELYGGEGNDVLIGGSGKDELTGGAGRDTFVFNMAPDAANADTIMDFTVGEDRIWLDQSVFGGGLSRVAYVSDTGALTYDAEVFATLHTKPATFVIDNTNFIVA